MSYQTTFDDLFEATAPAAHAELPLSLPEPATKKQIEYAKILAEKTGSPLPQGITRDRVRLSQWISAHRPAPSSFNAYPSSRQVGFAERIARLKRTEVPHECFRDRALMSRWIDHYKPR